jgi:hypothetical protein
MNVKGARQHCARNGAVEFRLGPRAGWAIGAHAPTSPLTLSPE